MNKELIDAASRIAVEVMRQTRDRYGDPTPEIIGSAFETAYLGLQNGMKRIQAAQPPVKTVPLRM